MKVTGILKHKLGKITGEGAKGEWQKQTIVIEEQGQYPNDVAIDFFNKPELLEGLTKGQSLTVSVNLKSREYQGRWFSNIDGWKIEADAVPSEKVAEAVADESNDLPF